MGVTGRYSMIYSKVWMDGWFEQLSPNGKLLWLFLLAHPNLSWCGIVEFSPRMGEFQTGIKSAKITELLNEFERAGKIEQENGYLWIRKYVPYQRFNPNMRKGAISAAQGYRDQCPRLAALAEQAASELGPAENKGKDSDTKAKGSEGFGTVSPNPILSNPYPNQSGEGETEDAKPTELLPDASVGEREILHEMSDWQGFKIDYAKSLKYIRGLAVEFPSVDLLDTARTVKGWLLDRPREKGSHARFRNFCKTAANSTPRQSSQRNYGHDVITFDGRLSR